jgi:hypothetical protein
LVALRTQLIGPSFPGGVVELPGLILAVERTGALTYNALALQDNLGGAAFPMPGGWAVLIEPVTGTFRALAFNVFPDTLDGVINGLSIPHGAPFTARVTATVYSDPSNLELINPADHPDLVAAAEASMGVSLPTGFLMDFAPSVPEPGSLTLLVIGLVVCGCLRRR